MKGESYSGPSRDRILIADDADIGRALLKAMFRKEYDVLEARNGLEVLQVLRNDPGNITAILLDVIMPVMDGFKVLAFMRENDLLDRIPIIALTAISDPEGQIRCLEAGATDIVEKPYDAKLLKYKLKLHIDRFRKQRELAEGNAEGGKGGLYAELLETLPDAVYTEDPASGTIQYGNERFRELCGRDPVGRTVAEALGAEPAAVKAAGKAKAALLKDHRQTPESFPWRGGETYALLYNALLDGQGEISVLVGVIRNVTSDVKHRKMLEERIAELERP